MSRVTKEDRRWRKKGRRGVSPIIATILLVAITVVLAAVLYILISGLTGSAGTKPFSVGFGSGNPSQQAGPPVTYYDEFAVSATSGLTTGIFAVKILNPTGTGVAIGAAAPAACGTAIPATTPAFTTCLSVASGWYALLANQNGGILASYDGAGWHLPAGVTSQSVTNSMEVVIVSPALMAGTANTLSVYGTSSSSVSGQVVL